MGSSAPRPTRSGAARTGDDGEVGRDSAARARAAAEPDSAERHYELGVVLAAAGRFPEALKTLLAAGERNYKLASGKVAEAMAKVFFAARHRRPAG